MDHMNEAKWIFYDSEQLLCFDFSNWVSLRGPDVFLSVLYYHFISFLVIVLHDGVDQLKTDFVAQVCEQVVH